MTRCAIYTRKSTDEGLEKEFNTLEAQREAGENYVKSQKHQGWEIIPTQYDDGGFSGGNMNRPALKLLIEDIKANKVDMIVVYKIDRLTRSLTDFSKLIEVLDQHKCSFVSVTQNFNTADSMGRLTLNMLLSFAQFEREITGERIRDKIEASKKKGMWTGGVVPYGYEPINKKLEQKSNEAEAVAFMFDMYLKYKSAMAVAKLMSEKGYKDFRRDAVRRMLKNPIYMGKIKHKGKLFDGQHKAIVSEDIFKKVQSIRETKDISIRTCLYKKNEVGILRGLLTCGCCHSAMTPTSCQTRGARRYYYTSAKAKYYGYHHCANGSVPVLILDECIIKIITPILKDTKVLQGLINQIAPNKTAEIFKVMQKPEKIIERLNERHKMLLVRLLITGIIVNYDDIEINWTDLALSILPPCLQKRSAGHKCVIELPFVRSRSQTILSIPEDIIQNLNYNNELIKAISKAFKYNKILNEGKLSIVDLAFQEEIDSGYLGRLLRLTCLAPDIIKKILNGLQPPQIYLQRLLREDIPPIWEDQRKLYNFKSQN